ncbi:alkaline phosphatase PHO8 NDAI_0C05260 [Naumovozyma dairenensis CBS 421]|uniref:Alkaline phosphatase n=1 Tax=Naumovozyma dairenensis (strain ATCC 10597 / BCRC 20456 / CBS 421 / NBRC 0211 / NRRL Y-12639) TaxID=1071378 RepID=G0W8S4_NAUDC|nr:hypothetical protein NDAI_0C05260 [Naumovozyma dairenensis CBS 421]CCD24185.1 hypothetical protein NDAI_0C05260 [Naumovozyma dairenensis CBS 421]
MLIKLTEENVSLIRNSPPRKNLRRPKRKAIISSITITIVAITIILFYGFNNNSSSSSSSFPKHPNKKNVILFITDGMGPASLSLTRSYRQFIENLPINDTLTLDNHLIGSSRTRSSDSLITDSAAGATAFSCILKTKNNAVGVNDQYEPCGTLLEAAKLDGLMTGLVVTTRITDATPAAFSAHSNSRFQEDLIALHQLGKHNNLGRVVDLMIGGGRSHFHGKDDGGVRIDGRNLIDEAINDGWNYIDDRETFDSLQLGKNVSFPLLALLAENDIPFDLDRNPEEYPSLQEQAITAVNALVEATKDSDKGFFLMIEGSRIDHAGHENDPAAQVREVLAFDKAFQSVLELVDEMDTETIVLSTSDHETGGLVTARQVTKTYPEYVWYPLYLQNAKHSGEFLKSKILSFEGTLDDKKLFIEKKILQDILQIDDYNNDDVNALAEMNNLDDIQYKLNDMVSFRAQIGWTTHGHSAVDVNIYGYANTKSSWYHILDHLQGNHENLEIGEFIRQYLNLDLKDVTKRIKNVKTKLYDLEKIQEIEETDDEYHHLAHQILKAKQL